MRDRFPGIGTGPSAPATVPVEAVATWDVSAVDAAELASIQQFLNRRLAMPFPVRSYFGSELASASPRRWSARRTPPTPSTCSKASSWRSRPARDGGAVQSGQSGARTRTASRQRRHGRHRGRVAAAAVPSAGCVPAAIADRRPVPVLRHDPRGASPRYTVTSVRHSRSTRVGSSSWCSRLSRSSGPRG